MNIRFLPSAGKRLPEGIPPLLCQLLKQYPQNGLACRSFGRVTALSCYEAGRAAARAEFALWITPECRRRGLGTALLRETLTRMAKLGVCEAIVSFSPNPILSAFAKKNGLFTTFCSMRMTYRGGPLPESAAFVAYNDADYPEYQTLQSKAFYDLRRSIDLTPYYLPERESIRAHMAEQSQDFFVLRDGGQIIAAGSIADGEIDDVAVLENYRGRRLGEEVAAHAVNLLLKQGVTPHLWCAECNPAKKLYLRMGFQPEEKRVYYRYRLN